MAGLWEDALAPYVGMANDLQSEEQLRRSLTLQEQMGRGGDVEPALPSWLPPEVQRYMRTTPSMAEGGYAPAPGWSYPGLTDEMNARRQMPGGQGREEALVRQIEQSRQLQNYPRDEGGVRGYAWGGSSTGPSPISDLIQRLLGNRQSL